MNNTSLVLRTTEVTTQGLPSPHTSSKAATVTEGWCIAFVLLAVSIIFGNCLVVAALLNAKFPHRARKYFLISLSSADLLVGAVAVPMFVYLVYPTHAHTKLTAEALRNRELFNYAYQATDIFTGLASVFTLTVISLEHTYAIMSPLQHRGLQKGAYVLLVGIAWALAAVISAMYLLTYVGKLLRHELFIYSMTVLSCFSVVLICVSYATVWVKVKCWISRTKRGRHMIGTPIHERNLSMALAIVTFVFVFTWLPFHTMNIIANFRASVLSNVTLDVICFTKLLHYSNSCINPIIYSLKLPEFRASVRTILCKLVCCRRKGLRETRV